MTAESSLQAAWLRRGPLAWALLPLAGLHAAALVVRRMIYRSDTKKAVRVGVPVVVVGNLVVGGAGKTPTTIALVALLRRHGRTPGVVSRGYGRSASAATITHVDRHTPSTDSGDEPLLIHLRTRAPVVVGADRVAAAQALLQAHPEVDVLISDDGLQHWRLARDAQVIVFDERGAGNGWLLPAGPLREPMPDALWPRSVVLYNAPRASTSLPGHVVRSGLSGFTRLDDWWAGSPLRPDTLQMLRGRRVIAAAGVARPQRFFDMLRNAGLDVVELALPDHHRYDELPWPPTTREVVITEKDAVKLHPSVVGDAQVWVATLDFALPPAFETDLTPWVSPAAARP